MSSPRIRHFFPAVLAFGAVAAQASLPPSPRIRVGETIASYPGIAEESARLRRMGLNHARFYVYLFKSTLPTRCLNLECGPFARRVLAQGGVLIGGADEVFRREAGLGHESPVVLVTDERGRITAIHEGEPRVVLPRVLRALPE